MSSDTPAPDVVRVFLFKDSYAPFAALLEENGIAFTIRTPPVGAIRNSGEAIEILRFAIPAVAGIIITYLKAKQGREVIITTRNRKVVHARGYSVEELGDILAFAENMNVLDTKQKAGKDEPREE